MKLLATRFLLLLLVCFAPLIGSAQILDNESTIHLVDTSNVGVGIAVDSLHVEVMYTDSLLKYDSIAHAREPEKKIKQLATMRELDLTYDGKPEVLRISGFLAPKIEDTKFTFTIKQGKKTLFEDTWTAKGYFEDKDNLSEAIKLRRLQRIITVFFANENFVVVDSNEFRRILTNVTPAELVIDTKQCRDLLCEPRVMYSVFKSRDLWYGLMWSPTEKRFLRAWEN